MDGSAATAFGATDAAVAAAAVAVLLGIAYLSGRKERDTRDFFLGGRRVPMVVAALSLVATEVSAITITNVPGTGFTENLQYLQFYIGSAASKVFVAFLFLPMFYKHDCTSIYEYLRDRFGAPTQYCGSVFFFITRVLGSGARLYAACLAIAMIVAPTGADPQLALAVTLAAFTAVSVLFIAVGGIKAVVWTGAYQAVMFYGAGLAVIVYVLAHVDGGLAAVADLAGRAGRLSVFNFSGDLNNPTTFWAGTANAFFIGLAVFGTDQELVQRLLTVNTRRDSQKALLTTILAALPVTAIYLLIGTAMFALFQQRPDPQLPAAAKGIFPFYIAHYLPAGLKGLMLATIILASIDAPLASLSSSFVMDIYRPLRPRATPRHYLRVSRLGVVAFGLVLALTAMACRHAGNVLWLAFQIISVTGGSMLGVFLVGLLTRGGSSRGNIAAMILNTLAMTALLLLSSFGPHGLMEFLHVPRLLELLHLERLLGPGACAPAGEGPIVPLAWSWLIVVGTANTFFLALALGKLLPDRRQ